MNEVSFERLRCVVCYRQETPDGRRFRAYLTIDGEAAVYCADCAEREFGGSPAPEASRRAVAATFSPPRAGGSLAALLRCDECLTLSAEKARGWRAYSTFEDDGSAVVVIFCPDCDAREFGDGFASRNASPS